MGTVPAHAGGNCGGLRWGRPNAYAYADHTGYRDASTYAHCDRDPGTNTNPASYVDTVAHSHAGSDRNPYARAYRDCNAALHTDSYRHDCANGHTGPPGAVRAAGPGCRSRSRVRGVDSGAGLPARDRRYA